MNANLGEANTTLLAVRLAFSFRYSSLIIEGNSLLTVLAINEPHLFTDWNNAPIVSDIRLQLISCSDWKALNLLNVSMCVHT